MRRGGGRSRQGERYLENVSTNQRPSPDNQSQGGLRQVKEKSKEVLVVMNNTNAYQSLYTGCSLLKRATCRTNAVNSRWRVRALLVAILYC
jgi:hypothetical protein